MRTVRPKKLQRGGLSDGQLSRKQCIDLYNLISGHGLLDEVNNLPEILNSLKIVTKCFENMTSDRNVRHEINNQAMETLCRCIFQSSKFSRRLLMSIRVLRLADWESAHRVFLTFARLFLSNVIENGGKNLLRLSAWKKLVSL